MSATDLLPSLTNLPAFYMLLGCLLALAAVSFLALIGRLVGGDGVKRDWYRIWPALASWVLLTVWTVIAASMVAVAGLVAGTGLGFLVSLGVVLIWALICVGLWFWVGGRMLADAVCLVLIAGICSGVYLWQRAWLCEPLAHSGFGHAQLCTARLYEEGSGGVIRNRNTARAWYRYAAEQGIAAAQYAVGRFTYDSEEKQQMLTRAADQGNSDAAFELYSILQRSSEGVTRLQQASGAGHPGAQYYLGTHYLNGTGGLDRNLPRARSLWNAAAEGGNTSAMQALAIAWARGVILFDYSEEKSAYWEGRALESARDIRKMPLLEQSFAVNWQRVLQEVRSRRAAAEAGDTQAMLAIGDEILRQAGQDQHLVAKGMTWVGRAAAAGSADAQYQVADYYLKRGREDATQLTAGRDWLVAAAESGHETALRKLIKALKQPEYGFQRDLERSRSYSEALFRTLKGRGIRPNEVERMSAGWEYSDTLKQIRREQEQYLPPQQLREQADLGDAVAQYHLGKERMGKDYAAGLALLEASARGGHTQAKYELAQMIRHRKRTPEEEGRAIRWLQEAAASDHRGAMVDLGIVYLQGLARQDIPRNPYRARTLFETSLLGVEDIVYEQKRPGSSWQYTTKSVNRWLDRVPPAIRRLQLEGLDDEARRQEINDWYERESRRLQQEIDTDSGAGSTEYNKELALIGQQRDLLLGGTNP